MHGVARRRFAALPMLVAQLGLAGLFVAGFLSVTADQASDRSAP